jgi:hypothetical protein
MLKELGCAKIHIDMGENEFRIIGVLKHLNEPLH